MNPRRRRVRYRGIHGVIIQHHNNYVFSSSFISSDESALPSERINLPSPALPFICVFGTILFVIAIFSVTLFISKGVYNRKSVRDTMFWALGLFLLCVGIGTLVVIYMWLAWYSAVHGFRLNRGSDPREGLKEGLSKSDIQKLPTFVCIRAEEEEEEKGKNGLNTIKLLSDLECAVCLDSFHKGEKCLQIPACNHTLHVQCADAWLSKRSVCPICRTSAEVDLRAPCQSPQSAHCGSPLQARPSNSNSSYDIIMDCENPPA